MFSNMAGIPQTPAISVLLLPITLKNRLLRILEKQ